jgi:hypothetical protein
MKLKIINSTHHRNGVAGAPFEVVLFTDKGPQDSRKMAILFDEPDHCAVLDIAKLAAGDIAFGSNSWRGDDYEKPLREGMKAYVKDFEQSPRKPRRKELVMKADAFRVLTFDLALETYGDEDAATRCIDLLTDGRHWCDLNGLRFAELDRQAYGHYLGAYSQKGSHEKRRRIK